MDAVLSLQSVVPAVPVGTTDGLHPLTLRKLNLRAQFQAILETDSVYPAIDCELRGMLPRLLAADLRDVTAVATAGNCAVLLHNVQQMVGTYHDVNQFTDQLAAVNRPPPPLQPAPPYPVSHMLELVKAWYEHRVETVNNELTMSPADTQFNLVLESMPTGDGQLGRMFDDIRFELKAHVFSPAGGVRGHQAS
jgi:hypothetical protein